MNGMTTDGMTVHRTRIHGVRSMTMEQHSGRNEAACGWNDYG